MNALSTRNTTTWVDERYGKQLARRHEEHLDAIGHDDVQTLATMRKSDRYLREQAGVKVGYGTKKGVRVWAIDSLANTDGVALVIADYDARSGRILTRQGDAQKAITSYVTHHALARLFERLRTNAWSDVRRALSVLTAIPTPGYIGGIETADVATAFGRFVCVSRDHDDYGPIWLVKTFLPPKRT